jgi:hypothetical protein
MSGVYLYAQNVFVAQVSEVESLKACLGKKSENKFESAINNLAGKNPVVTDKATDDLACFAELIIVPVNKKIRLLEAYEKALLAPSKSDYTRSRVAEGIQNLAATIRLGKKEELDKFKKKLADIIVSALKDGQATVRLAAIKGAINLCDSGLDVDILQRLLDELSILKGKEQNSNLQIPLLNAYSKIRARIDQIQDPSPAYSLPARQIKAIQKSNP